MGGEAKSVVRFLVNLNTAKTLEMLFNNPADYGRIMDDYGIFTIPNNYNLQTDYKKRTKLPDSFRARSCVAIGSLTRVGTTTSTPLWGQHIFDRSGMDVHTWIYKWIYSGSLRLFTTSSVPIQPHFQTLTLILQSV
ncbi:hypothetical protein HZ326_31471, partial [Fusarium oxysporum f. sp. albedinis]